MCAVFPTDKEPRKYIVFPSDKIQFNYQTTTMRRSYKPRFKFHHATRNRYYLESVKFFVLPIDAKIVLSRIEWKNATQGILQISHISHFLSMEMVNKTKSKITCLHINN